MAFQSDAFQEDAFQIEEVVVLTATATTTPAFQRLIGKQLTAAAATAASVQKLLRKTLTATAAAAAVLVVIRQRFVEVITRQMASISITLRERENE